MSQSPALPAEAGRSPARAAFTLVEMLVVIAIIAVLIGLIVPTVNVVRESGRRSTCLQQLRQVGQAAINHESKVGWYPTGGWGAAWVGDPDRGFGARQPGGPFYNMLPYLDMDNLHDLGKDNAATKKADALTMIQTAIPFLTCPSRRRSAIYPMRQSTAPAVTDGDINQFINCNRLRDPNVSWFRGDYKVNGGTYQMNWGNGPSTTTDGDALTQQSSWKSTAASANGVSFQASQVQNAKIIDGNAQTYLVLEKYLNPDNYNTGVEASDDHPALGGAALDTHGFGTNPPLRDKPNISEPYIFGSPHPGGFGAVFCDGNARTMSFTIDPATHKSLSSRNDGAQIDVGKL